jgi:hypothetical protein
MRVRTRPVFEHVFNPAAPFANPADLICRHEFADYRFEPLVIQTKIIPEL